MLRLSRLTRPTIAMIALVAVGSIRAPVLAQERAGGPPHASMLEAPVATARLIASRAGTWVRDGYRTNPVIMTGLAGLAVLPVLALAGLVLLGQAGRQRVGERSARGPAVAGSAWLQLEGHNQARLAIEGEVLQIGREADNDFCIGDSSVHRYHAVIERLPEEGIFITDVSGPQGNGVRVNGRRLAKACLSGGDLVEIGRARFRFETAQHAE